MNSWVLRGQVVKGHQRGGTMLGFPTANIKLDEVCMGQLKKFLNTVWCGFALVEDENVPGEDISGFLPRVVATREKGKDWRFSNSLPSTQLIENGGSEQKYFLVYPTVLSVGNNPHFRDVALTVEPHIVHKFAHDFYDRHVRIVAVEKMRDMGAFTTLDALIAQIKDDCRVGSQMLERPQTLRFRSALFDPKIWTSCSSSAPTEDVVAPASLPGAVPNKSFFRMLHQDGCGEEKQQGASQL